MNSAHKLQPDVTAEERSKASQYLAATRDELAMVIQGLSVAEWQFKPAPDRWSIAEVVEHLVIVESRVQSRFAKWPEGAERSNPDRIPSEMDARILAEVPVRTLKIQAPPQIVPAGQWKATEALERFLRGREETLRRLASTPALRAFSMPHPVFGLWDGYHRCSLPRPTVSVTSIRSARSKPLANFQWGKTKEDPLRMLHHHGRHRASRNGEPPLKGNSQ